MGYLDTIGRLQGAKWEASPAKKPWLEAWQDLARLTYGMTESDPRLPSVISALNRCDMAFARDEWEAFQKAAQEVRAVVVGSH